MRRGRSLGLAVESLLGVGGDEKVFFGGSHNLHGDMVLAGEKQGFSHLGG